MPTAPAPAALRRPWAILVAVALAAGLAVAAPAPPAHAVTCGEFGTGCTDTGSGGTGGGGTGGGGGGAGGGTGSGSGSGTTTRTGYSPYPSLPVPYYSAGSGGLYRATPTGLPASIEGLSGSRLVSYGNQYTQAVHNSCAFDFLYVTDPLTGQRLPATDTTYGPYLLQWSTGVRWTDKVTYGTSLSGATVVVGRTVTYSCVMPAQPQVVTRYCATSSGPMTFTGPFGKGLPVTVNGSVDVNSTKRVWTAPRVFTTVGTRYAAYGPDLGLSPTQAANLVANCPSLTTNFAIDKSRCTTTGGAALPASSCEITPGNYHHYAPSQVIKCRYIYYPATGTRTLVDCGSPYRSTAAASTYDVTLALYCDGRVGPGPDWTYVFSTCGGDIPTPRCEWGNGRTPTLTTPDGAAAANGVQAPADGRAWAITYPRPTTVTLDGAPATVRGQAQQWVVSANSSPSRGTGVAAGAGTQPFFANPDPAVPSTGRSVLTWARNNATHAGWGIATLHVRLSQAAASNGALNSGRTTVVGDAGVPNPRTVTGRDALVPLGIYAQYDFVYDYRTTTSVGGTVTITVPGSCSSAQALLFATASRVAP